MNPDGGDHDPLWAVTKPKRKNPANGASAPPSAPVPDKKVSAADAMPTIVPAVSDLDANLRALGITFDDTPVTSSFVTPTTALPDEATAPVAASDPAGSSSNADDSDPTLVVGVEGESAPASVEAATTDLPMSTDTDDEAATAPISAVSADEPTEAIAATGFASDPLATVVMPASSEVTAPVVLPGEYGNTAIITTPVLDPTPPGGNRIKVSRQHSWRRRMFALCALVLLAGLGYYVISLFQVWQTGMTDHREESQVIAVMGAAQYDGRPSPQLQARLDHAYELFDEGVAPIIYVTGGKQDGDRFTEAEASRDYLVAKGVPEMAIMMESSGHTTWESMQNMSGELKENGLQDVVIVTDPYHSMRSKLIAEELGLTAHVSPTLTSPVQGRSVLFREMKEAGGVAVGRIIGFGRLSRFVD